MESNQHKAILSWLSLLVILLIGITLLGGAVRLTDSGLSITEWQPVLGVIPPLSTADWSIAFEAYQQIPQYKIRPDIDLDAFKTLYWWEWSHRLMGRVLALVFAIPFLFFLCKGWLTKRDIVHYSGLLLLGALQGVIGWFMVQSGLSGRVSVAPFRLALHLGLAMVIYAWLLALVLERVRQFNFHWQALGLVGLTFAQLILGAVVAGLDGGLIYNGFLWGEGSPLTASVLFSGSLWENAPLWQLIHRLNGATLLLLAAAYFWKTRRRESMILLVLLAFQVALGLATLLTFVALPVALLHHLGGVLCWSAALFLLTDPLESHKLGVEIKQ